MNEGQLLDRRQVWATLLLLAVCTVLAFLVSRWFFVGTAIFALILPQALLDRKSSNR